MTLGELYDKIKAIEVQERLTYTYYGVSGLEYAYKKELEKLNDLRSEKVDD